MFSWSKSVRFGIKRKNAKLESDLTTLLMETSTENCGYYHF